MQRKKRVYFRCTLYSRGYAGLEPAQTPTLLFIAYSILSEFLLLGSRGKTSENAKCNEMEKFTFIAHSTFEGQILLELRGTLPFSLHVAF
jgi:hypothetical protein